jgi:uncharacterized membrane protein
MFWSGTLGYIFLSWNLFLAWIPLFFSYVLMKQTNVTSIWIKSLLFIGWLIFFPNSPYILTDLFHLHERPGIPLWFDLVLLLSFAWNGMMIGFFSLLNILLVLKSHLSERWLQLFTFLLLSLCGFGIYLGRYPRWNSWDVVTNPFSLCNDILQMVIHPLTHTRMVGVTFFFSLFLMIAFQTLRAFIQNFNSDHHGK